MNTIIKMKFSNKNISKFTCVNNKNTIISCKDEYNKFQKTNPNIVNIKEIIDIVFHDNYIEIAIKCTKPLVKGREGNALRSFSILLVNAGFDLYLTKGESGKLFCAA